MVGRKEVAGEYRRAVPERRGGAGAGTSLPAQAARVGRRLHENAPLRVPRRAGCGESRTSGSEGGGEETTGRKGRHWRLAADPARADAANGAPTQLLFRE